MDGTLGSRRCHHTGTVLRLRHDFGDEYAHSTWGPDLGLADDSTVASPLYTLVDRQSVERANGTWEWEYKGRYLNGSESEWLPESECLDSFTPLQLDVFHALWELYHTPDNRPRPAISSSSATSPLAMPVFPP